MSDQYTNLNNNIKDISKNCKGFTNYHAILENQSDFSSGLIFMWKQAFDANSPETFFKIMSLLTCDYNANPQVINGRAYNTLSSIITDAYNDERDLTKTIDSEFTYAYSQSNDWNAYDFFMFIKAFLEELLVNLSQTKL